MKIIMKNIEELLNLPLTTRDVLGGSRVLWASSEKQLGMYENEINSNISLEAERFHCLGE